MKVRFVKLYIILPNKSFAGFISQLAVIAIAVLSKWLRDLLNPFAFIIPLKWRL